jgi:GH15 family glucan-1,4-alpha-glucosidase
VDATTNGPYSPAPYYLRLTKDANPNDGSTYNLGDNFPRPVDEREIVDQSFLGLVLFGVKAHDDPTIRNSLAVGDELLKVDTPHGPMYRFAFDGYGETEAGADWDIFPQAQRQTLGRLWPLLTGERRIRAHRRAQRNAPFAHDRRHGQRRAHAARAGVGPGGLTTRSASVLRGRRPAPKIRRRADGFEPAGG